jgi:hypothetical protein
MNNVVRTGGFVLIALGILAILLMLLMGESFPGLTLDSGAMLLAGGLIALGLSTLTAAVETLRALVAGEDQPLENFEESPAPMTRPFAEALSAANASPKSRGNAQGLRSEEPELTSSHILDTPKPTEERFSVMREVVRENGPPPPEPEVEDMQEDVHDYEQVPEEAVSEEELYVIEERTIAGKPARILSDGTVEAETDDGWMRFENVEHLEEYMEAVRSQNG